MDFFITDRTFALKTIVSTHGNTTYKVKSATDVIGLENNSRRMTMELSFTRKTTAKIKEDVALGNYVLYQDLNDKFIWMTIMKVTHDPLTLTRTLECEDAGLDLLNETVSDYKADKAYNVAYYINKFTNDSGFVIGINEISNLTRKLEWEGTTTALERIHSVATQFDNAELEFSFEFEGNELVKRKIDIYKKRGKQTNFKMYVNKDIHSIKVEEDLYSLVNALYITGGTLEGKDTPVTLKGYNWTDPDKRFYLDKNTGLLKDTQNVQMWSRTNTKNNYFVQHKTYESTDQKTLVNNGINDLKKYSVPVVNYVVDVANMPYDVRVGDTLEIVDQNEELYLSSRVQTMTIEYHNNDAVTVVLSDFIRIQSGLSERLIAMGNDFKNEIATNVPFIFTIKATAPIFINGMTEAGDDTITLTATVTRNNIDVSDAFHDWHWTRLKANGDQDLEWSASTRQITVDKGSEMRYTYQVTANNE